jgi:VWFA-related protein
MITRLNRLLLALVAFATIISAQDSRFGITVNVPLVSLQVMVHDDSGNAVTDLTQNDFNIYENGQLQELRSFSPPGVGLSVFLLVDRLWYENEQAAAVQAFVKTLRPLDRIAVASLDDFKVLMNWRTAQSFRLQDIDKPPRGKPEMTPTTDLYTGLEEASRNFGNEKGRRAIVVITHGRDREIMEQTLRLGSPVEAENDTEFRKHLQTLQRAAIPIHIIAKTSLEHEEGKLHGAWFWHSDAVMAAFLKGAQVRMEKLADITEGRILFPKNIEELEPLFRKVGLELGISYALTYAPRNNASDGTRRAIEVHVRRGRVTQSRTEYMAQ